MKKTLSLILAAFLLCGCSSPKGNTKTILQNISFTAKVSYYNENYLFEGTLNKDGELLIEVNEPEEIKEMQIIHNGQGVNINYKGLTYLANDSLPLSHTTQILYDVMTDCRNQGLKATKKGENLSNEGKVDGKEYIANFSPSGIPLNFKVPGVAFEVYFSDVKILKTE